MSRYVTVKGDVQEEEEYFPFSPSGLWPGPQNREGSGRKKVKNMKSLLVLLLCVGLLTIYTGRKLSGIHLRRAVACHIQLWGDL